MDEATWPWSKAVVVGASSGIGEAIGRELAARGCSVALLARREERLASLAQELNRHREQPVARAYVHDVRDVDTESTLFQEIATEMGGLDLVVYASGILPRIGAHEYPTDTDLDTIATNFSGAVAWLNEAARRFEKAGAGTIIGVSSVAGDRGRRANVVYNATKAGLDTYLEGLRSRLAVRGVTVLTAKPGVIGTAMSEGRPRPKLLPVPDAMSTARQILDAAAAGKRVAYMPGWWRWVMLLLRMIPAPVFERMNV